MTASSAVMATWCGHWPSSGSGWSLQVLAPRSRERRTSPISVSRLSTRATGGRAATRVPGLLNWPFNIQRGRREDRPGFASRGSEVRVPLAPLTLKSQVRGRFAGFSCRSSRSTFPRPCPIGCQRPSTAAAAQASRWLLLLELPGDRPYLGMKPVEPYERPEIGQEHNREDVVKSGVPVKVEY